MNLYIIVEGDKTELSVYPSWIAQLAPQLSRIEDAWEVADNNYYLFSGGGIPHIYSHIVHAVDDISGINAQKDHGFDYLLVCLDTEESNRAHFHHRYLKEMFKERHMQYAKNNTTEVQKESYWKQLIARYTETGHLSTFGHWYEFITSLK